MKKIFGKSMIQTVKKEEEFLMETQGNFSEKEREESSVYRNTEVFSDFKKALDALADGSVYKEVKKREGRKFF